MPVYEYRCGVCDSRFDARRPAPEADLPARCPQGHLQSRRLLSVFAAAGRASASEMTPRAGGCCGGGCGCG